MLKLKDKVVLSPESLYARPVFQNKGGHLSTEVAGTIVKVLSDLQEGWFVVKFKYKGVEKTNTYIGGVLVTVKG